MNLQGKILEPIDYYLSLFHTDWEVLYFTKDILAEKWVKCEDFAERLEIISRRKMVSNVIDMTFPALHEMN